MKAGKDKKKRAMEGKKKECIRILIADDHSVVREGLVSLVKRKSDMSVVAEASNGREAVDLWKSIFYYIPRRSYVNDIGLFPKD